MPSIGRPTNKVRKGTLGHIREIERIAKEQVKDRSQQARTWGEENLAIARGYRDDLMKTTDSNLEFRQAKAAREIEQARDGIKRLRAEPTNTVSKPWAPPKKKKK